MMRTQIQLPDRVYAEAKRIAQEHEISLARWCAGASSA